MQVTRTPWKTGGTRSCIIPGNWRAADYRETRRVTGEASRRTSIKSRKPLIAVDVHARFRPWSVRHVSSSSSLRAPRWKCGFGAGRLQIRKWQKKETKARV